MNIIENIEASGKEQIPLDIGVIVFSQRIRRQINSLSNALAAF